MEECLLSTTTHKTLDSNLFVPVPFSVHSLALGFWKAEVMI